MLIGPLTLLAALLVMSTSGIVCAPPDVRCRLRAYVGGALVVGVLAYVAGAAIGIYAAYSSPSAGNLCGLYGVFATGPLLSGIAILVYASVWAKNAGHAP